MNPPVDFLLLSILTPLGVALAIALGLPKRFSVKLAYLGFGVPAAVALYLWSQYGAAPQQYGYAFLSSYDTGLAGVGINLILCRSSCSRASWVSPPVSTRSNQMRNASNST